MFDADGVIQKTRPEWLSQLQLLCGNGGVAEAFVQDVFAAEQPCLTGKADFAAALAEVLRRWNSRASVQDALSVWTLIDPQAEVLALVERLRARGVTVALATNQQRHRAAYMRDELGYACLFDHLLVSCELGIAKPDVAYFQKSLSVLDVPAEQVLFIDDHQTNVEAARRAGLKAAQFHLYSGVNALESLLDGFGLRVG